MTPEITNPDLETAKRAAARLGPLFNALGITRVCLHGSRAKGTAHPDSDWDFQIDLTAGLSRRDALFLRDALARVIGGTINLHAPGFTDPDFIAAIQPFCVEIWK